MRKPTAKELVLGCVAIAIILTVINGIIQRTREPEVSEEYKRMMEKACIPVRQDPIEYKKCLGKAG